MKSRTLQFLLLWLFATTTQAYAASLIGDRAYTYDANGNQTGWDHVSNGTRRTITWDEENRIQAIADNGHTLTYVYDDAGERVIKSGPQGETAYVNQFFVVRNRAVATKHIFAGGTRLVSKMATQPAATSPTAGNSDQAPWGWLNSNAGGNSPNSGGTVFEKDQYYFHPDHLGSSSYVTDIDGEIFQHLEYFPFGETFVEESSNTQRTPYLFTGKELDEETGLYYFGARYYDPRTSVWQSPDPILASYMGGKGSGRGVFTPANLNLYGYVQQHPVNLIDPDGQQSLPIPEIQPEILPNPANDNNPPRSQGRNKGRPMGRGNLWLQILADIGFSKMIEENDRRNTEALYRGLSLDDVVSIDSDARGVVPNNPSGDLSPEEHAMSSYGSQFVSLTSDPEMAEWFATHGDNPSGIVAVYNWDELERTGNLVYHDTYGYSDEARAHVDRESEILFQGTVPNSALMDFWDAEGF